MMKIITIEECIEILSGTHESIEFTGSIENSDKKIIYSLARQTIRGIPYTDRQYDLAKNKLEVYSSQLEAIDIDVTSSVDILRMPLREIDRARWIQLIEHNNQIHIGVRFTFNKKLITAIESLSSIENKNLYDRDKKIHFFNLNEKNLYDIITILKDKNFVIQTELQERYDILETMNNNKNNYIPGVYGLKLKNLHDKAIDYAISTIGSLDITTLALYKDRSQVLGINYFDQSDLNHSISNLTSLSQKIVKRSSSQVLVNSNEHTFDRVAESILELNRYPLLICLNDNTDFDNLQLVHYSFRNIFANDDFCTLYRKENDTEDNIAFNQYIKNNNINNPLANNSKIVYTTINKISKTLLKSTWRPEAAILMGSIRSPKMDPYLQELDLVIHYDTDISPFTRYGSTEKIEKI